ncbi:hypothetical protein H5203_21450 [Pseudoalteromonas sp. SG41-1]|uniref:hypothetical protein n=1 Tax=Pseudoalteromonas sp. SG41-1 TaxID=2760979 RepID=UPI00160197DC|nr:hypothetical protein [Pseudoalteromonas sp. SG41-1]MBB1508012.1 hypothetical protein [Pseudoalteromonas sp. SG41-1]
MSNNNHTDKQVSDSKLKELELTRKEEAAKKRASDQKIAADEKLSKMLKDRADRELDFYAKQQQREKLRAEKLEQQEQERLERANEEQKKRERTDSKKMQNMKVAHNNLITTVIRAKSKGISLRANGTSRPNGIIPKKFQAKAKNISTGKTNIASFVATESFASPHSEGMIFDNSNKVDHNYSVKVAKTTKEILDNAKERGENITRREAKVKAEAKHAGYRKQAQAKAKKSTKGSAQVYAIDEHNFRIEVAPNSEIEYDPSMINQNLLINYVPAYKYTVYKLVEDANIKFKNIVEETNNPSQYEDDPRFEVRENFLYTVYENVENEEGLGKIAERTNDISAYVNDPRYTIRQNSKAYFFGEMTKGMRIKTMETAQSFIKNQFETYLQRVEDNKPRVNELTQLNKKANSAIKQNIIEKMPTFEQWSNLLETAYQSSKSLMEELNKLPSTAKVNGNIKSMEKKLEDKTLRNELKKNLKEGIKKANKDKERIKEINKQLLNIREKTLGKELSKSGSMKTIFKDSLDIYASNKKKLKAILWFKANVSNKNKAEIKQKLVELKNKYNLTNSNAVEREIRKLTSEENFNKLVRYNKFLTQIQWKFNKDKGGFINLDKLRKDKNLKEFYASITDEDIAKYQQSDKHISDLKRAIDLEKRIAEGKKATKPLFSSKELNSKEYVATRLLIESFNLTNNKSNQDGYISQVVRKFTINNERQELGLNEERSNLPSTDPKSISNLRTMTYTVLTFPTFLGSSFEFIEPEDMVKAAKYRMAKLYPNYDILNMQLHVDEHHSHIHIQNSNLNRETGFYDFGRTKVDLVNEYNVDNYVKRQQFKAAFEQDLSITFQLFDQRKKEVEANGEVVELEDVLNHVWIAIDEFVEDNDMNGFNFSTVRPALEILIKKYGEGLNGSKDFSQAYELIKEQVMHIYNEKPRIYDYGTMSYSEKVMFGMDFENMNFNTVTKEFFSSPEMKKKYPNLEFTNLDETDYRRHEQRVFYNNSKGIDNSFTFQGRVFQPEMTDEEVLDKKKNRNNKNESKLKTGRNTQQLAIEKEFKMYATEQELLKHETDLKEKQEAVAKLSKTNVRLKKSQAALAAEVRQAKEEAKLLNKSNEKNRENNPVIANAQVDFAIKLIEVFIGNTDYDFEIDEIKQKVDKLYNTDPEMKKLNEVALKSLALRNDNNDSNEMSSSQKLFKAMISEWYRRDKKVIPDNLYYAVKDPDLFSELTIQTDKANDPNKVLADEYCLMSFADAKGGLDKILSQDDIEMLEEIIDDYGIDLNQYTAKETLSMLEDFKLRADTDSMIMEYEERKNKRRYKPKLTYTPDSI